MKSQREIFGENLEKYLNKSGLDQRDLALKMDVSDATISNWINGKKFPRLDKIQKLADLFSINKSDLIEAAKPSNILSLEPRTVRVPILGKIACGDPIDAIENIEGYIMKSPEDVKGGDFVAAIADGQSMAPTIPHGAVVTIRRQPEVENGQIVAALVNGDEQITLKRYRKQGNTVLLTPDNPKYDTIVVDESHPARIIGKVTGYEVRF